MSKNRRINTERDDRNEVGNTDTIMHGHTAADAGLEFPDADPTASEGTEGGFDYRKNTRTRRLW